MASCALIRAGSSSDIDIYVYGLTPGEANEKIKHLFDTFRANLPAGAPTLVVRNCTTITFYARYPLRRIQIVLKLAESPKSVLLNFDLDVCAMGWDGTTLWMLPRAARALETGRGVFTMNLIRGHYLSDRRASTQERIFKYADKGYGLRFLPSYLSSLTARKSARGQSDEEALLSSIADGEREWTEDQVAEMLEGEFARGLLECLMPRFAGYRGSRCLKSFKIFMRCVALWEMGQRGEVTLKDDIWASTSYQDVMTTHDEVPNPPYKWDQRFDIAVFQRHIAHANANEIDLWASTDLCDRLRHHADGQIAGAQRTVFAPTVDILLGVDRDILMQVLLPCEFAVYANALVRARGGLSESAPPLLVPAVPGVELPEASEPQADGLFLWRIGAELMW
ncbi:hypothetical protein DFH09DRAFT_133862 [Mycena vulgaris]|nr:hypothetical protein DFH09DRAFT_133862 [Mycena vulgaris]